MKIFLFEKPYYGLDFTTKIFFIYLLLSATVFDKSFNLFLNK